MATRAHHSIIARIIAKKPSMYSHSLILNLLGMHVYRILFFYLWRKLRFPVRVPKEYKDQLRTLERDGILVIPNFFSPHAYARIKEEFERLSPQFEVSPSPVPLPHVDRMNILDKRVSDFFRSSFVENRTLKTLTTGYLNRAFHLPMDAYLTRIFCNSTDELHSPKNGGTDNLHFDAPLRTLKAFYYVADTTKENAALKYCIGSNKRNTLKRLWFEYKLSIRYARNKSNTDHGGEYVDGEPWVVPADDELNAQGITETDMEVKGNTLVIVDIGGFHRRGDLHSLTPRQTVEINYRSVDTLLNVFYPIRNLVTRRE